VLTTTTTTTTTTSTLRPPQSAFSVRTCSQLLLLSLPTLILVCVARESTASTAESTPPPKSRGRKAQLSDHQRHTASARDLEVRNLPIQRLAVSEGVLGGGGDAGTSDGGASVTPRNVKSSRRKPHSSKTKQRRRRRERRELSTAFDNGAASPVLENMLEGVSRKFHLNRVYTSER
jgi:hypothetical protein